MWNFLPSKDMRTSQEKILQDKLDSLRAQQEREERRRDQEREQARRARHEEYEYEIRSADNWPDALNKQRVLCQRETSGGGDETVDDFFAQTAAACEMAEELWHRVENSKRIEIQALENQIAVLNERIRLEVADGLEVASPRHEYSLVAQQLRENDIASFLNW